MKTETWKYGDTDRPLHWRLPRHVRLEVPSDATDDSLNHHFAVMALCPHHWFVVIGDAGRMAKYLDDYCGSQSREDMVHEELAFSVEKLNAWDHAKRLGGKWQEPQIDGEGRTELDGYWEGAMFPWPLPNVTQACRIRTQADADRDLPQLIRCPAVERWVYVEPSEEIEMLFDDLSEWACHECGSRAVDTEVSVGPDDVGTYHCLDCDYWGNGEDAAWSPLIHGVTVTGGDLDHARPLRDQCRAAGVKFACDLHLDGVEHGDRPGEGR